MVLSDQFSLMSHIENRRLTYLYCTYTYCLVLVQYSVLRLDMIWVYLKFDWCTSHRVSHSSSSSWGHEKEEEEEKGDVIIIFLDPPYLEMR